MPYICLARNDIPDGTVQILDLKPNTSQRSLIYEPPGQTRYVNRAVNEAPVPVPTSGAVSTDFNGLQAYIADRFDPANLGGAVWSEADLALAAATLLGEVDLGNELTDPTTTDTVTTVLTVALGAAVGFAVGGTTAVLTELLSVLAGRGYVLPAGSIKLVGAAWDAVQRGAFTEDVLHFGTTWDSGEIVPANIGGDTVAVETKPIRHTYDSTHFQVSLGQGHLATFQAGVTLFPDSDLVGHYPWLMQGTNQFPQVDNARVVTVYNDDGTLA
jgi:tetrahydromethanopterin S-methyltransferase subunit E